MSGKGTPGSGGRRSGRRLAGREVRERLERAVERIAAAPGRWPEFVNSVRTALGRPALDPSSLRGAPVPLLRCERAGGPVAVPLDPLVPLDKGGMNSVFRSADLFASRPLVVRKHLPAGSAVEAESRRARDAVVRQWLTAMPRHPILQRFWASGVLDGDACDLFDFAPGIALSRHVREKGLTYGALLDVAFHGARALRHLQRLSLVHGDVKPENFCVEERVGRDGAPRYRVRLIDFDIVSTVDEQIHQYKLANTLDGTLPYMPPENFIPSVPEDPAEARRMVLTKDVFALGMALVRCVNGRFPEAFYTSMEALLKKKEAFEEPEFDLPISLPAELRSLIRSMVRSDWRARPPLALVIRTFEGLRRDVTPHERARLVLPPRPEAVVRPPEPAAPEASVGPYRLVNRAFASRPPGDGQWLPLAELQDPFGRRLVGVPFAFRTADEEEAFYRERCTLLADLNAVRLSHAELFPGSFRDLVRQEVGAERIVWIVRPLLEGAIDVTRFLAEERPDATPRERVSILRRVAEALAVLEAAGYTLPRLGPDLVFFVPLPGEEALSVSRAALTRPIQSIFDIPPLTRSGRRFRQELMGTASARRIGPAAEDRLVKDFLALADGIGLVSALDALENGVLLQVADVATWRERVELLVWLEMQAA